MDVRVYILSRKQASKRETRERELGRHIQHVCILLILKDYTERVRQRDIESGSNGESERALRERYINISVIHKIALMYSCTTTR